MSNVSMFKNGDQKLREELRQRMIAQLEETLARAKDGQVVAVGLAYVENDGFIGNWYSGESDPKLACSIGQLDHRFKSAMHDAMQPRKK